MELALLGTRTQFGQFVINLQYVCRFNNLMMTPIRVLPSFNAKKIAISRKAVYENGSGVDEEIMSKSISSKSEGEGGIEDDGSYRCQTDQKRKIPMLNLERERSYDSSFKLTLELMPRAEDKGAVDDGSRAKNLFYSANVDF